MPQPTGNKNHDATVVAAQGTLQSVVNVAGVSQATANTATIAYYRSLVASAISNGLDAGPFIFAMKILGATP